MEKCPHCNREFENFREIPLIKIEEVVLTKPEDVPKILPFGGYGYLVERKLGFFEGLGIKHKPKGVEISNEIADFLRQNPGKQYAHSDGFVYQVYGDEPLVFAKDHIKYWSNQHAEFFGRRAKNLMTRSINVSANVVGILSSREFGECYKRLKSLEGSIVKPKEIKIGLNKPLFHTEFGGLYLSDMQGSDGVTGTLKLGLFCDKSSSAGSDNEYGGFRFFPLLFNDAGTIRYKAKFLAEK